MCELYVLITKWELVDRCFIAAFPETDLCRPNLNVSPWDLAQVIAGNKPNEVQLIQFDLSPFWASKPIYFFNARRKGNHNKENDPRYMGAVGIISKPAFWKSIRSQHFLVIADAFIDGTTKEKINKPFVFYFRNPERPFAFTDIWTSGSTRKSARC